MPEEVKTTTLILIALVLVAIAAGLLYLSSLGQHYRAAAITNFDECAAAGNPIMESYPEQCRTADGRTFVNQHQTAPTPPREAGCVPAGCSKEVCVDASRASEIVTSCVYLPQFECYKTARCERQADGRCGWTETAQLKACIANSPMPLVDPMTD